MSAREGWKTPAKKTPEEKEAAKATKAEAAKAALKAAKKAAETKTRMLSMPQLLLLQLKTAHPAGRRQKRWRSPRRRRLQRQKRPPLH